jgi:hypothetical protein
VFVLIDEDSTKSFLALGKVIRDPQELVHWLGKITNYLSTLDTEEKWLDFLSQLDKIISEVDD